MMASTRGLGGDVDSFVILIPFFLVLRVFFFAVEQSPHCFRFGFAPGEFSLFSRFLFPFTFPIC